MVLLGWAQGCLFSLPLGYSGVCAPFLHFPGLHAYGAEPMRHAHRVSGGVTCQVNSVVVTDIWYSKRW
uniref:Putative secreted peptide n=1 Tax=Anopheles braziliensis TaxID=58242 RepID=A0A2M3ZTR8_9DIPT